MTPLEKVKDLKVDFQKNLDFAERWQQGSSTWDDLNECDKTIDAYKKFVKYLEEMEDYLEN